MMQSETSKPRLKDEEKIGESKINEIISESTKSDPEASNSPSESVLDMQGKNEAHNHAKEIMNATDTNLSLRENERIAIIPEEDPDEDEDSNIESWATKMLRLVAFSVANDS